MKCNLNAFKTGPAFSAVVAVGVLPLAGLLLAGLLFAACPNARYDDPIPTVSKIELVAAITAAEAKMSKVEVSGAGDGSEFKPTQWWVTRAMQANLERALDFADEVNTATDATQVEINIARDALTEATKNYTPERGTINSGEVDISDLAALIAEVQGKQTGVWNGVVPSEVNGTDISPSTRWVSQAVQQALDTALANAIAAKDKDEVTWDEVDEAQTALEEAVAAYRPAYGLNPDGGVYKTGLIAKITQVQEKKAGEWAGVVTNEVNGIDIPPSVRWVSQAVQQALDTALANAIAARDNASAQLAVNNALSALEEAEEAYVPKDGTKADKDLLIAKITQVQGKKAGEWAGVQASAYNGGDIDSSVQWVSQAVQQALDTALANAIFTRDEPSSTQSDVDTALSRLTDAETAYTPAPGVKPNKAALIDLINTIEQALADVVTGTTAAEVPSGVRFITQAERTAIDAALAAAKGVRDDHSAVQGPVDNAVTALQTAYNGISIKTGGMEWGSATIIVIAPGAPPNVTLDKNDITLSWLAQTSVTVAVTGETFATYAWYVDGLQKAGVAGSTFNLKALDYRKGAHTLAVKVTKGGSSYTEYVLFTVTE